MCDRCSAIQGAFGSRDPLPPRIASLDAEPKIAAATELTEAKLQPEDSIDTNFSKASASITLDKKTDNASKSPGTFDSVVAVQQDRIFGTSSAPPTLASTSLSAAALTTTRSHTSAKASDMVTLSSEGVQPKTTTNGVTTEEPRNILISIIRNLDILHVLMRNCPDFSTLFALVTSCQAAQSAFEQHPQGIIKAMLSTMSQELEYLTVALIGINGSYAGSSGSIKTLMETWLGKEPKPLEERLRRNPIEIVRKLACSFSAIDRFMEVIPKNCVNNFTDYKVVLASREGKNFHHITDLSNKHPILQQTEWSDVPDDSEWEVPGLPAPEVGPQAVALPLNDRETYRIRRALLRYELFCSLFYLGPDPYFDRQQYPHRFNPVPDSSKRRAFVKAQAIFLRKYVNPWEIGELAVISQFMYDLVRNAYFHKYKELRYQAAQESWYGPWGNKKYGLNRHNDHEEVADDFDNHLVWFASQGLTLMREIYDDRNLGYQVLVGKHGRPLHRFAELFIPFERCADRHGYSTSDPLASWKPTDPWSDTPGMEKPSKGWLAKSPYSENAEDVDGYWGEKWTRKIGYFIWDRD